MTILWYIVFIVLLFVVAMQYFQFKDKKKPTSILFLSLFLIGIVAVFFIQKNINTLNINREISWAEKMIFSFLGILFLCIIVLKYIFLKNKKQQTKIDKFWMYQSFSLIILMLIGMVYFYHQQLQKKIIEKQYFQQSIFVKNGLCYADTQRLKPINYILISPTKTPQIKIQSLDMVYLFSIKNKREKTILIPQKNYFIAIPIQQDTLYFAAEQ